MALPSLYSISTGKSIQTAFGGLNESYACAEAEFTEMKNFSSRGYPALQTRTPRRTMRAMGRCNGMYHLNGLLLCEGTTLRYTEDSEDDVATAAAGGEIVLENAVTDSEKIMIGMGTKILIWPDAKSFDTATGKLEALSAAWSQTGTVTIAPCDAGGKTYTVSSVGTTEPSGPADGTLFLKQNSSSSKWAYVNVLEQYDAKSGKWAEILLNSVKMTLPGLAAAGFKKGDTITVEQVPGLVEEYLAEGVNGEVTIEQMDGDSIVLTGSPKTESAAWSQTGTVTIAPCDAGGKTYTVSSVGTTEPSGPADGTLFLKQNSSSSKWAYVNVLEQYDAKSGKWAEILLNSVKMTLPGLAAAGFKKGDTITVEQVPGLVEEYLAEGVNGEVTIEQMDGDSIVLTGSPKTESARYYGSFTVTAGGTTWKSMNGSESATVGGTTITARRRVPRLEYVTENANRVWGCNSEENVIYSCKLGDPTNWYSYRGIASDSYAVNVGSDGPFTGAATCMGYVLFFKENCLHKLYGSRPADYQLVSVQCRGVAKQASKSMCVLAEVLYYLSPDGVMAWDGSLPVKISGGLDNTWLMNVRGAVGGVLDTRYYLHLRVPGRNETRLLVYDTERRLWHEEDTAAEENASGWAMCSTGRQLYQWDGVNLWATEPEREADRDTDTAKANLEQKVSFEAVSGDIGLNIPADKYINRVFLRVDALTYSVVELQASYEGGAWETLGQAAVLNKYTRVNLPFVPERHDTMRLRIKGTGQIAVRSIAFSMAESRGNRVAGGEPKR